LFYQAAPPTLDTTDFNIQVDSDAATREVSHSSDFAIIKACRWNAAARTDCFFLFRVSCITRAVWSPNTPMTVTEGVNPGNL
jgi:hypothetical protein